MAAGDFAHAMWNRRRMATKNEFAILTPDELTLLAGLGHLIMFWNRCEYAARQILREQVVGTGGLGSSAQLAISKKTALELATALVAVAPSLVEPGRPYVEHFANAFDRARENRNRFVHGLWQTVAASPPRPATGILLNAKPKGAANPLPAYVTLADIKPVSDHIWVLAEYGRQVGIAFTRTGARRLNQNGDPEIDPLPDQPSLLQPCTIEYFISPPSVVGVSVK